MRKIRLGRTHLTVSEVGMGGVPIERLPFDEAVKVVRHCADQGMTLFESGHAYGDSEDKMGAALSPIRDQVILATKTLAKQADKAYKHVEHSLQRFQTDHIDIYQFHNIGDEKTLEQVLSPGGSYEGLQRARDEGKIGFIGLSSHDNQTAIKACLTGRFDTLQIAFNFVETEPADEVFRACEEMDMGILIMKPLGGGRLERADLCFKFLQQYPNILPIPGIESCEGADEIIDLYRSPQPLTKAEWEAIEAIRSDLGKEFCHRCEYCMPCEQKVGIPLVLLFKSVRKLWEPAVLIPFLKHAMASVDECIDCEECIEKCPYHLPIPELLRDYQELFDEYVRKNG